MKIAKFIAAFFSDAVKMQKNPFMLLKKEPPPSSRDSPPECIRELKGTSA
jgi:hypothetical protein